MRGRIKLTREATDDLGVVKGRLRLAGQDDLIVLRIALGRSLQTNIEPIVERELSSKVGNKRKEIQFGTLEQQHGVLIRALIAQRYQKTVSDSDYEEAMLKHIEHGLWLIKKETENLTGYDYLTSLSQAVFEGSKKTFNKTTSEKVIIPDAINVNIGRDKKTNEKIIYSINLHNNPHFAVIGGSGSGKTYFLKHLLGEIRKSSKFQTNFIIFDYKDGDIATDRNFVKRTKAKVIDVSKKPLPLNLFWDSAQNERAQKSSAERVVDIVSKVEASIGKVQEQNLYDAIISAYETHTPYPDFNAVKEELEARNTRPDSLSSVLRPITEQNYFARTDQNIYKSWTDKTLIIDIHNIEKKDLVCFFVLNQIHRELKKLGVSATNNESGARQIRTVIVIDEAHYFLGSKKRTKILQDMIRDVRSSGGAIVLASQSPDDYDKTDFDFLELMEFPVILKSTPKSHKFLQQKFGLDSQAAKNMLYKLGDLERGEAYVMEGKKVKLVELCK